MMRENTPGGDPTRASGCSRTGGAEVAATQGATSTHSCTLRLPRAWDIRVTPISISVG